MDPTALVEVDLYSGRQNPHFALQPAEAGEFMKRLAALPPTDGEPPTTPLGYRGLRVRADQSGSVSEIQMFNGVVTVQQPDGAERTLSDPNRDTERWLLDVGAAGLDGEVVTYLRTELGQ